MAFLVPLLSTASAVIPTSSYLLNKIFFTMHTPSIIILILFIITNSSFAQTFTHDLFDQTLQKYVNNDGAVDYPRLKANPTQLDTYISTLAAVSPETHPTSFPTQDHKLAYWINAYNAFVLKGIVDTYPIQSVKDIGILNSFFRRKKFTTGNREITLDDLENKIIRPLFRDPRIHFVVNCGAASCPILENRAFTGDDLESRLQAAALRTINDPRYVRLGRNESRLYLSKILKWYRQDFIAWFPQDEDSVTQKKTTLQDYIALFLPPLQTQFMHDNPNLEIVFNEYNWSLNSMALPSPSSE